DREDSLSEAEPASTTAWAPIDVTAQTTSSPTLTSATPSLMGSSSSPKKVVSAPKGTVANATNAGSTDRKGASVKSHLSAPLGRSSSLNSSLRMSAIGCSTPCGPTRYG